ncbi:hypothetical protein [Arenibaculum pallidiluteum]|uniref:hypothetical protein n=1 Tax=Arenibaculum pallidiluteum TaxID=2812559 RepID=UPI001A95EBFF|nr:hypothetical protein [Arenibaculum pallidiluteum]
MKPAKQGRDWPVAWVLLAGVCVLLGAILLSVRQETATPPLNDSDNSYSMVFPMVPRH